MTTTNILWSTVLCPWASSKQKAAAWLELSEYMTVTELFTELYRLNDEVEAIEYFKDSEDDN